MKTFNENKNLKKEVLAKLKHHQDLDTFVQGTWLDVNNGKVEGNGFKGCFYGCTMQTNEQPRQKFSEKYHVDLWYCYITEKIFEGLPKGEYEKFPYESIKNLPIGVDLNKMKSLYHYKILENQLLFCQKDGKTTKTTVQCMELFKTPFNEIDVSVAMTLSLATSYLHAAAVERSASAAAWAAAEVTKERSASAAALSITAAAWAAETEPESDYYIYLRDTLFECIKETYK